MLLEIFRMQYCFRSFLRFKQSGGRSGRNGGAHAQRFAEHERQPNLSRYFAANI